MGTQNTKISATPPFSLSLSPSPSDFTLGQLETFITDQKSLSPIDRWPYDFIFYEYNRDKPQQIEYNVSYWNLWIGSQFSPSHLPPSPTPISSHSHFSSSPSSQLSISPSPVHIIHRYSSEEEISLKFTSPNTYIVQYTNMHGTMVIDSFVTRRNYESVIKSMAQNLAFYDDYFVSFRRESGVHSDKWVWYQRNDTGPSFLHPCPIPDININGFTFLWNGNLVLLTQETTETDTILYLFIVKPDFHSNEIQIREKQIKIPCPYYIHPRINTEYNYEEHFTLIPLPSSLPTPNSRYILFSSTYPTKTNMLNICDPSKSEINIYVIDLQLTRIYRIYGNNTIQLSKLPGQLHPRFKTILQITPNVQYQKYRTQYERETIHMVQLHTNSYFPVEIQKLILSFI